VPHGVLVPREVRREFWGLVRGGLTPAQAAVELGVSKAAGNKWFRDAGGVLPRVDACPEDPSRRTITLAERESIGLLRAAGMGVRAIARELGRQPGVISKELARNTNRAGAYRPLAAQSRAEQRARRAKPAKLARPGPLRDFVVAGLKEAWSPVQISNVLRMEFPDDPAMRVCPETIYQALYVQSRGALRRDLAAKLRSGRATRKPRRPTTHEERRGRLAGTISISERPAEVADRAVPGHWEGDLIMGRENGSAIGTLVERSTRFVLLLHLPTGRGAVEVRDANLAVLDATSAGVRAHLRKPRMLRVTHGCSPGHSSRLPERESGRWRAPGTTGLDWRVSWLRPARTWWKSTASSGSVVAERTTRSTPSAPRGRRCPARSK
jgi:transposase, IS30 family